MFHDRGERDGERRGDLGYCRPISPRQAIENGPPRRIREGRKCLVELGVRIVNHVVKYCPLPPAVSSGKERASRAVERLPPPPPVIPEFAPANIRDLAAGGRECGKIPALRALASHALCGRDDGW